MGIRNLNLRKSQGKKVKFFRYRSEQALGDPEG
jgi:hypothetical protein